MNASSGEKRILIGQARNDAAARALSGLTAFILVLCPIFQHYRGLVTDAGIEMLLLAFPYTLLRLLTKRSYRVKAILPLAIYAIYISLIHGFSPATLVRELVLLFYFFAIINDGVDIDRYFGAAKTVAKLAAVLIVVQYFCYYVLHRHLQLAPASRLLESAGQWKDLVATGRISVTGSVMSIYRPSAFFLEPSHFAIYFIPVLTITLLSAGRDRKRIWESIFLSAAVVLSTSGMGVTFVAAIWILYLVFYFGENEKSGNRIGEHDIKINKTAVGYLVLVLVLFLGLYLSVGFFRSAVNRIFLNPESGTGNAIQGRTSTGIRLMRMLSGVSLLIGKGNSVKISDWNVSGFFYVVFQFGLLGGLVYYWFYFKSLFRLKKAYFWLTVFVMGLSFVTVHTFAAFFRMYFICHILIAYSRPEALRRKNKKQREAA